MLYSTREMRSATAVRSSIQLLHAIIFNCIRALLLCCCFKLAGTFGAELVCMSTPNLTETQVQLCTAVPDAMIVMNQVEEIFRDECSWQFKTNRWNCTGISPPIYVDTGLQDSPESAFIHALTSAITAHKITEACYDGSLGTYCGPDDSQYDVEAPEGWRWGSSYNTDAGRLFAQQFLDDRPLKILRDPNSTVQDLIRAQIHLHNNAVGRQVIDDTVYRRCTCHGISGSCSVQRCINVIRSIFEVGDIMKEKYEEALKVTAIVQNGAVMLQLDVQRREGEGEPPATELIYMAAPTNHCLTDSEYTTSRMCLPEANRTSVDLQNFYPSCEGFCCTGRYASTVKTITETCDCVFDFCCDLKCYTCEHSYIEYYCIGANNTATNSTNNLPTPPT